MSRQVFLYRDVWQFEAMAFKYMYTKNFPAVNGSVLIYYYCFATTQILEYVFYSHFNPRFMIELESLFCAFIRKGFEKIVISS